MRQLFLQVLLLRQWYHKSYPYPYSSNRGRCGLYIKIPKLLLYNLIKKRIYSDIQILAICQNTCFVWNDCFYYRPSSSIVIFSPSKWKSIGLQFYDLKMRTTCIWKFKIKRKSKLFLKKYICRFKSPKINVRLSSMTPHIEPCMLREDGFALLSLYYVYQIHIFTTYFVGCLHIFLTLLTSEWVGFWGNDFFGNRYFYSIFWQ